METSTKSVSEYTPIQQLSNSMTTNLNFNLTIQNR